MTTAPSTSNPQSGNASSSIPTDSGRALAWYQENSENFRGLNSQMWQIPIIGMTLTGGLWFGVSNVKDSPLFQMVLLGLAAVGNGALIIVLFRLRFVMTGYMNWINTHESGAKIDAEGTEWYQKNYIVRTTFQIVLGLAASVSLVLMFFLPKADGLGGSRLTIESYYDEYAERMADEYEVADFQTAHPYLATTLPRTPKLLVLDVGSGVSRDAPAMTALGHNVTVAVPSRGLAAFDTGVVGALPKPKVVTFPEFGGLGSPRGRKYDLVVLNGVWSHIPPEGRKPLIERLIDSLHPGGRLYMAFRDGPTDPPRAIYSTSVAEVRRLAVGAGVSVSELPSRKDIRGRSGVSWRSLVIRLDVPAMPVTEQPAINGAGNSAAPTTRIPTAEQTERTG